MTYNELLAGFPGVGAKYNLLKDYKNTKPEDIEYLLVEVRCGDYYSCFYWGRSFSYCLFGSKFMSETMIEQKETLKANNPDFYTFAESVKNLFGH